MSTEWQRSSACEDAACVEVRRGDDVEVRSSSRPDVTCVFTRVEWAAFLRGARAGEFDVT